MQRNLVNKIKLSLLLVVPLVLGHAANARKYIPTHEYTCKEIADVIQYQGYVDVPNNSYKNIHRVYDANYAAGAGAEACAQVEGYWRVYDVLDANGDRCTPGVLCVSLHTKRKPGNGWFSCNGVFHSGSRKDHPYCPEKKKK